MTYQLSCLGRFLYDMGIHPEEINSRKFLKEFKKKYKVKVHDIPPTQPKSWAEMQMVLFNFESYGTAPIKFALNPTLKLLYIISPKCAYPNMVQIPGTSYEVFITDAAL